MKALFLLLVALTAQAQEIRLFDAKGNPVANYDEILAKGNLKVGDEFIFADGSKFELVKTLGEGGTSKVFAVKPVLPTPGGPAPYALRLRSSVKDIKSRNGSLVSRAEFLTETVQGYPLLKQEGVATPAVKYHYKQQYVLTEIVPHDFDGTEFFHHPENIAKETLRKAEASLERFAESVAKFEKIGDFKPGQLVYNESQDKWFLLDWTNNHDLFRGGARRESMFSPGGRFAILTQELWKNKVTGQWERQPLTRWQKAVLKRLDDKLWEKRGLPEDCRGMFARLKSAAGF